LLEDGLPHVLTERSEQIGAQILGQAMRVPIQNLIKNKTDNSGAHIIDQIENSGDFFTGFDVKNEEICDMMDRGIYDSLNVIKVIL
jgi:chaperonin GroEL (HSP60 family)